MWVWTPEGEQRVSHARDAQIGFLHDRRSDHLGRLAVGHQRAVVQHDDAVGQRAHHVHLVLDQQDRAVARRLISWMRSRITGTSSTLMPAVGSSNMKTVGPSASRMPTSSLRWSPCGSALASASACAGEIDLRRAKRRPRRSARCARSTDAADRARRRACACTARRTFSRTVRLGKRLVSWKARPRPRRVRRAEAGSARDVLAVPEHARRRSP